MRPTECFTQTSIIQISTDGAKEGGNLVEVCQCLKIGPLLDLLFLTKKEAICIEEFWGLEISSIN